MPSRLHSDQGGEFENQTIRQLNKLLSIEKSRTTPYHPQSNGACERMNQTLLKMLRTLSESDKSCWPDSVNKLIHAYNCSPHSSTGYSPFFLMFGREPKLPIDLMISIKKDTQESDNYNKYVQLWKRNMKEAYGIAYQNSVNHKKIDENRWNEKISITKLNIGDRVLIRNMRKNKEGPSKLVSFWEPNVYRVVDAKGDRDLVYGVKREDNVGGVRVVHRNMLLLVNEDFDSKHSPTKNKLSRMTTRLGRKIHVPTIVGESDDDSSDEYSFAPDLFTLVNEDLIGDADEGTVVVENSDSSDVERNGETNDPEEEEIDVVTVESNNENVDKHFADNITEGSNIQDKKAEEMIEESMNRDEDTESHNDESTSNSPCEYKDSRDRVAAEDNYEGDADQEQLATEISNQRRRRQSPKRFTYDVYGKPFGNIFSIQSPNTNKDWKFHEISKHVCEI